MFCPMSNEHSCLIEWGWMHQHNSLESEKASEAVQCFPLTASLVITVCSWWHTNTYTPSCALAYIIKRLSTSDHYVSGYYIQCLNVIKLILFILIITFTFVVVLV